jgi:hypothetical protein
MKGDPDAAECSVFAACLNDRAPFCLEQDAITVVFRPLASNYALKQLERGGLGRRCTSQVALTLHVNMGLDDVLSALAVKMGIDNQSNGVELVGHNQVTGLSFGRPYLRSRRHTLQEMIHTAPALLYYTVFPHRSMESSFKPVLLQWRSIPYSIGHKTAQLSLDLSAVEIAEAASFVDANTLSRYPIDSESQSEIIKAGIDIGDAADLIQMCTMKQLDAGETVAAIRLIQESTLNQLTVSLSQPVKETPQTTVADDGIQTNDLTTSLNNEVGLSKPTLNPQSQGVSVPNNIRLLEIVSGRIIRVVPPLERVSSFLPHATYFAEPVPPNHMPDTCDSKDLIVPVSNITTVSKHTPLITFGHPIMVLVKKVNVPLPRFAQV